jgi:flagellar L-ring protein precursor FlgH
LIVVLLHVAVLGLASGSVQADSLWERRDPRFANLFQDTRARRVGDILTIVVRENTDIEHKEERDMKRKTKLEGNVNLAGSMSGNVASHKFATSFDGTGGTNKEFDSKADYTDDRRFVDRMSVVVVGVLPNGNLVIEGYRKRIVSGEMRMLKVRGLVWPPHIGPANTIQSQFIADFEVEYVGKGAETRVNKHGWFSTFLGPLWPF